MLRGFSISIYLKSKAGKRKPEDSKILHSGLREEEGEEATGQVRTKGEEWDQGLLMHVRDCGGDKWIPDSCFQRGLDLLLLAVWRKHWVFFPLSLIPMQCCSNQLERGNTATFL